MTSWDDYPPILTTEQAGEILGIKQMTTIIDRCKSGEFPAMKVGGKTWRIDRDKLRMMLASKISKDRDLVDQLGEIELALSTLAAIHRDTKIESHLRMAHMATLAAFNRSRAKSGEFPAIEL